MKKAFIIGGFLALSAGLVAYGVSPSQYRSGQAQDAGQGMPGQLQPAPNPVPMGAVAPGGQPFPTGDVEFAPSGSVVLPTPPPVAGCDEPTTTTGG